MKYILQDKKTESGSYTFEQELDGFVIMPKKGKQIEGLDIKEVVIADKELIEKHVRKNLDKKIPLSILILSGFILLVATFGLYVYIQYKKNSK